MDGVTDELLTAVPAEDIERRYRLIREAMERDGLSAVIVAGSEYTGFEGAVTYMSGFVIVHRYGYVLLPLEGDPVIVFPREARYVGEHGTTWIEEQVFVDCPGEWLAEQLRGQRVGVYGLEYAMTVRDFRALAPSVDLVSWDEPFDHARAVKSDYELASVRDSVRINTEGFWRFLEAFEPGRSEREILAPPEEYFIEEGCGRQTMDMVLVGENGAALPEFKIAGARRVKPTDMMLPSLEVAGPGGHWVEVSRAICPGEPSDDSKRMLEAYHEYFAAAKDALRDGATAQRRPPGGRQGLSRPRLSARPRHRPLDRHDDDRVPEDRRGRRDGAADEHGPLDASARDLPGRQAPASTCRTPGSSRRTAASRSPTFR